MTNTFTTKDVSSTTSEGRTSAASSYEWTFRGSAGLPGGTYFVRAERPERSVSDFEGTRLAAAFVTNRPVIADRVVTRPIAADAAVFRCATVPDGATMRDFFALLLSRVVMSPL